MDDNKYEYYCKKCGEETIDCACKKGYKLVNQEKAMEKNWIKSKTFWAALLGIGGVVSAYLLGSIEVSAAITQISAFAGMFGVRDALK